MRASLPGWVHPRRASGGVDVGHQKILVLAHAATRCLLRILARRPENLRVFGSRDDAQPEWIYIRLSVGLLEGRTGHLFSTPHYVDRMDGQIAPLG